VRVVAASQLTLELQGDVRQRFATLRECLHWTVLNDPRGLKAVAADCDLSVSELSRRLHPSDGTHFVAFDVRRFPVDLVIASSHDVPRAGEEAA